MYLVKEFYEKYQSPLKLQLVAGSAGLARKIQIPEAHCPGLSLCGYLKYHVYKRALIFGRVEIEYLRYQTTQVRSERLEAILHPSTPAAIVTRGYRPLKELYQKCDERSLPLFRTRLATIDFLNRINALLLEEFAPSTTCHGTFVEIFGVGVLIQGDSSTGKSEAALAVVDRGHRLIADDVVKVTKKEGGHLEGSSATSRQHYMEIKGIGIIKIDALYGARAICDSQNIDIVVRLEPWQEETIYDRIGLEEHTISLLGIAIPHLVLPIAPQRNIALLLETIALNHTLKKQGYHSARELIKQLNRESNKGDHD